MITAWLRIHYAIGGTAAFPRMLRKYHDAPGLCRALEARAEEGGLLGRVSPERFFAFDIPQALAAEQLCRENGWRIVPFPSDYYPDALRRLKDPPAVLFAAGDPELLRNPRKAAVVGARTASRAAADAAALLGEALAKAGVTVVSGGADGVDSAAALGAAGVPGAGCVMVLGRGFSPEQDANRREGRAVFVTELFPGTPGRAFNFPRRNRIIAGMSAGTVVMEAGGGSGALITADCALRQGKPVFVPDAASLPSPGCASLAAKGAKEIFCPGDCVKALFPELAVGSPGPLPVRWTDAPKNRYGQSFFGAAERVPAPPGAGAPPALTQKPEAVMPPAPPEAPAPERGAAGPETRPLPDGLSGEALAVAETLADGPRYVDEIIEQLGIPAPQVQIAVTELELEDVVAVGPGGRISLL